MNLRQVDLSSKADLTAAFERGLPTDLSGTDGDRLDAWLAQAGIDGTELAVELEASRRLFRNWTPGRDAREAMIWLHYVPTPSFASLCSDVADAVAAIQRSELADCMTGYLERRAGLLLDGTAKEILGEPGKLASFLSGTHLRFADDKIHYWQALSPHRQGRRRIRFHSIRLIQVEGRDVG
jgi:hypothetical protein